MPHAEDGEAAVTAAADAADAAEAAVAAATNAAVFSEAASAAAAAGAASAFAADASGAAGEPGATAAVDTLTCEICLQPVRFSANLIQHRLRYHTEHVGSHRAASGYNVGGRPPQAAMEARHGTPASTGEYAAGRIREKPVDDGNRMRGGDVGAAHAVDAVGASYSEDDGGRAGDGGNDRTLSNGRLGAMFMSALDGKANRCLHEQKWRKTEMKSGTATYLFYSRDVMIVALDAFMKATSLCLWGKRRFAADNTVPAERGGGEGGRGAHAPPPTQPPPHAALRHIPSTWDSRP